MYVYTCIYIYIERERDKAIYLCVRFRRVVTNINHTNNSNTNDTHTDTDPISNNVIMMIMANTS